jgi:hypothetical protein
MVSGGVWNYIEMKVGISPTDGTFALRLNGVSIPGIADKTGLNTGTGTINRLVFNPDFTWGRMLVDDIYVASGSGSVNNDFLGDVRVETLYPTASGTYSDFSRGGTDSGSNWSQTDEAVVNDDTDFVYSSTVGHKDLYTMSNLNTATGTVYGVQADIRAKKSDSGTRGLAGYLRVGASEAETSSYGAIATSYQFHREVMENKPGGTGWTISDVNGLEFGVKVTV